uniref:Uncharacterized protein n=1 Tax=Arundo donax TaxID=35708 RepID=A0A0A9H0Q6_ARUDO
MYFSYYPIKLYSGRNLGYLVPIAHLPSLNLIKYTNLCDVKGLITVIYDWYFLFF